MATVALSTTPTGIAGSAKAVPSDDRWSFAVIYLAAFLVFLPIAVVAQALTVQWRPWFPGAEGEKSLIGGVMAAVSTFMSLLI
jgi:light-harvesting complex 1 beta chain